MSGEDKGTRSEVVIGTSFPSRAISRIKSWFLCVLATLSIMEKGKAQDRKEDVWEFETREEREKVVEQVQSLHIWGWPNSEPTPFVSLEYVVSSYSAD